MRRGQRQLILFYVFIGLAALGILQSIAVNPMGILLPAIVIGVIFLLYKYPPSGWRGSPGGKRMYKTSDGRTQDKRSTQSKRAKFRVIPGTKRDDDDHDNIPKYH